MGLKDTQVLKKQRKAANLFFVAIRCCRAHKRLHLTRYNVRQPSSIRNCDASDHTVLLNYTRWRDRSTLCEKRAQLLRKVRRVLLIKHLALIALLLFCRVAKSVFYLK